MADRFRYHPPPLGVGDRVRVIAKGVYGVVESVDGEFLVVQGSDGKEYRRKALGLRHCPTEKQIANKCRQMRLSRMNPELREALGLPRWHGPVNKKIEMEIEDDERIPDPAVHGAWRPEAAGMHHSDMVDG